MNCSSRFLASSMRECPILFLPAPRGARYDRTKWHFGDPWPDACVKPAGRALLLAGLALAGCAKTSRMPAPRIASAAANPRWNRTRELVRPSLSWAPRRQRRNLRHGSLTAAHRTLPFGTWVRVVNLTNEKTVDVRIIDRGPFVENRIIDLSHAAAEAIALIGPGVAPVRLDILSVPATASADNWYAVQAGAFLDQRSRRTPARIARARLRSGAPGAARRSAQPSGEFWWDASPLESRRRPWPRGSGRNPVPPL